MSTKGARLTVAGLVGLLAVGGQATAAHANESTDVTLNTRTYVGDTIMSSTVANGAEASEFVQEQAAAGWSVDIASLTTAKVPGLTLVWQAASTWIDVANVTTAVSTSDPENIAESLEIQSTDPPELVPETGQSQVANLVTGAGLQATNIGGAKWQAGGCATATGSRGKLTHCRHKYKITESNSTYDYYFYDRWATANGNGSSLPATYQSPVKVDIRSRPRSTGTNNINGLVDYTPRTAITSCTQAANVSISFLGFSAGLPMQECNELAPYPNATTRTMRALYDQGTVFSGRTRGADFGVVFRTPQGKSAHAGHYNRVYFCGHGFTAPTCSSITALQSGW